MKEDQILLKKIVGKQRYEISC